MCFHSLLLRPLLLRPHTRRTCLAVSHTQAHLSHCLPHKKKNIGCLTPLSHNLPHKRRTCLAVSHTPGAPVSLSPTRRRTCLAVSHTPGASVSLSPTHQMHLSRCAASCPHTRRTCLAEPRHAHTPDAPLSLCRVMPTHQTHLCRCAASCPHTRRTCLAVLRHAHTPDSPVSPCRVRSAERTSW